MFQDSVEAGARTALRVLLSLQLAVICLVALSAGTLHVERMFVHRFPSLGDAFHSALAFFNVLQMCLVISLIATFQERVPFKGGIASVVLAGLAVAGLDVAQGSPNENQMAGWLESAWCVVSVAFHFVAFGVALVIAAARVAPPRESEIIDDYKRLDYLHRDTKAKRRNYANVLSVAAAIAALAWALFSPAIFAVVLVHRDLSDRLADLEADVDHFVDATGTP